MNEQQQTLRKDLARNTAELLSTDIELATTMVHIAAEAPHGSEKRERNLRNSRKAYHDVSLSLAKNSQIESEFREELAARLERLHRLIAEVEAG